MHPAVLPICERVLDPGPAGLVALLHRHRPRRVAPTHPRRRSDHPPAQTPPADGVQHHVGSDRFHRGQRGHPDHPRDPQGSTSPDLSRHYDSIPAEMAKGSVLVWHGSLWHGGGANTTADRRVGIAMNYCAGYIRQQENQQLGLPARHRAPSSRRGCRSWWATGSTTGSSVTSTRRFRPSCSSARRGESRSGVGLRGQTEGLRPAAVP